MKILRHYFHLVKEIGNIFPVKLQGSRTQILPYCALQNPTYRNLFPRKQVISKPYSNKKISVTPQTPYHKFVSALKYSKAPCH